MENNNFEKEFPVSTYFQNKVSLDGCLIQIHYNEFKLLYDFFHTIFELNFIDLFSIMDYVNRKKYDSENISLQSIIDSFAHYIWYLSHYKVITDDESKLQKVKYCFSSFNENNGIENTLTEKKEELDKLYQELQDGLQQQKEFEHIEFGSHMIMLKITDYEMYMRFDDLYKEQSNLIKEIRKLNTLFLEKIKDYL